MNEQVSGESQPEELIFTQAAAQKVWELIQDEGNLDLNLRVYITGGGCSGFQYGFSFDESTNPDDTVIVRAVNDEEDEGDEGSSGGQTQVRLLVDALSYQYLDGAEIDFRSDLQGEQFVIRNPNAKTTCGCGSSFSI